MSQLHIVNFDFSSEVIDNCLEILLYSLKLLLKKILIVIWIFVNYSFAFYQVGKLNFTFLFKILSKFSFYFYLLSNFCLKNLFCFILSLLLYMLNHVICFLSCSPTRSTLYTDKNFLFFRKITFKIPFVAWSEISLFEYSLEITHIIDHNLILPFLLKSGDLELMGKLIVSFTDLYNFYIMIAILPLISLMLLSNSSCST